MQSLHMSRQHLITQCSVSGAEEVSRMKCEAIKSLQQQDEMTVNISDHTVGLSSGE